MNSKSRQCSFCGSRKQAGLRLYGLGPNGRLYGCKECYPVPTEEEMRIAMRNAADCIEYALRPTGERQ